MLNLMYITNSPKIAKMAESAGVDRIFVDMEYIGKSARQGGMDTVQCRHTLQDVQSIKSILTSSKLLVRCNPIHEKTAEYCSSQEEIDGIIENGADIIMLPYFKSEREVKAFLGLVKGRAKTLALVETPDAVERIDEILALDGLDEIFIGLNDLSLGYGKKFMFELLADGTVEKLCKKFQAKGIPYGFGGIAALGKGMLPAERVIAEHYRLGSTRAILSRSFCRIDGNENFDELQVCFKKDLQAVRDYEKDCEKKLGNEEFYLSNKKQTMLVVKKIVAGEKE